MKYLKTAVIILILFGLFAPVYAAQNLKDAFEGDESPLQKAAAGAGYKPVDEADVQAEKLIGDVIQVILSFLGVIFLILMIYGGYMWMLARGNDQQVAKAKQVIGAAIVGVIIVVASYAISYFILAKFSETTLDSTPERLGNPEY